MKATNCALLMGAAMLTACGSKQDANEKNFGAAITQSLARQGHLCLRLHRWPVDVTEMDVRMEKFSSVGTSGAMKALASAGLVTGTDTEVEQTSLFGGQPNGQKYKVKRYVLTPAGKQFYREEEVSEFGLDGTKKVMQGDICFGKKSLDKIVKWEGPMKFGEYQEARVKYLYKIDGLADWAKSSAIQAAFPGVADAVDGAGKQEEVGAVKLTSQGWEPRRLD